MAPDVDIDELGRALFGRRIRLRVAIWALKEEEGYFYLSQAAEGVRYTASGVREELERLVALGMLRRINHPGNRRVYYGRTPSALWKIIAAAEEALRERDDEPRNAGAQTVEPAEPMRSAEERLK